MVWLKQLASQSHPDMLMSSFVFESSRSELEEDFLFLFFQKFFTPSFQKAHTINYERQTDD